MKTTRLSKSLSQAQLAAMLKTKQPAIERMESGHITEVRMDFLLKTLLALDLTLTIKAA
ncbi:MAG: XRE family transcriptional regulator [Xanthomonadaceae bacterium]|nr:XRE family transcriptional regulator [Xanthomonadaceae bacterium]